MRRFLVALLLLAGLALDARADPMPSWSTWQNQRGSVLSVGDVGLGGMFSGQFVNNAEGFQCRGTPYPVSGRGVVGGVVFVVTFTQCNSVTRWRGTIAGRSMRAPWVLTYFDRNGNIQILRGTDYFQRTQ